MIGSMVWKECFSFDNMTGKCLASRDSQRKAVVSDVLIITITKMDWCLLHIIIVP